jgi:DNA-binding NarL/FixJ family response regulator
MSHGSCRSILLVDDDPVILDTLGHGLRQAEFEVTQCRSARDALAEYVRAPPDLAIVDIGLPDMRGTALAEQLLEHSYRPILILSNHSEPEWVERAIGSGAIGYLVKPLTPPQLIPSIETSLARFGDINQSIASNFGYGNATWLQLQGAMDQFPFGVVIIDKDCQIILCNSAGKRFLHSGGLLQSINGKLTTSKRNQALNAVIDRSLGRVGDEAESAAYSTHDPEAETSIQIVAIPQYASDPAAERTATIIINDTSLNTAVPTNLLKSLYGFTEKESKLAHALAKGMTIKEYCEKVFVTPNTARTHLKSIYRKTSTNRQAKLIGLLSRLYINLPDEEKEDG